MIIYQLAREYRPYACAGGLKEVVTGLAKSFAKNGHNSSVFLPLYGFINQTGFELVGSFKLELLKESVNVDVYYINDDGVKVYLFDYPSVKTKRSVYTYTIDDEKEDAEHKRGYGFLDNDKINLVLQLAFVEFVTTYLEIPDVINLHDGHTGLVPAIIKDRKDFSDIFANSKLFFTIHNAGSIYHQRVKLVDIKKYISLEDKILSRAVFNGYLDPLCLASLYAKVLTVSPYYAKEIRSLEHEKISDNFGNFCKTNNINMKGIINGADIDRFASLGIRSLPSESRKMSEKKMIAEIYNINSECTVWGSIDSIESKPLFLFQNRITEQKGIKNLIEVFNLYKQNGGVGNLILMGTGESLLEEELKLLVQKNNGSVCFIQGYSEALAMHLFLSSDFFILPSLWEPCGLTDFEALLVGSIPLVNKTGGLKKITNNRTGFVFKNNKGFLKTLVKCEVLYNRKPGYLRKIKERGHRMILKLYTWDNVVTRKYIPLFLRS